MSDRSRDYQVVELATKQAARTAEQYIDDTISIMARFQGDPNVRPLVEQIRAGVFDYRQGFSLQDRAQAVAAYG